MYTGYFGNIKNYSKNKDLKLVSIARFNRFWKGLEYKKLAPPADIIKIEDEALYTRLYYDKKCTTNLEKMQYFFVMKNGMT